MPEQGWIRCWRKIENWEWYTTPNMAHLFQHLFRKANHEEKKWRGISVKRGQLVTSLQSLKKQTGISVQSLRTCIGRLISTGEITSKSTNKYRLITICNYEAYQNCQHPTNKQSPSQLTSNQQSTNNQLTTNNNYKNEKNYKKYKDFTESQCIEAAGMLCIPEKTAKIWYDHYAAQDFKFSSGVEMKDIRLALQRHKSNGTLDALVEQHKKGKQQRIPFDDKAAKQRADLRRKINEQA